MYLKYLPLYRESDFDQNISPSFLGNKEVMTSLKIYVFLSKKAII